MLDKGNRLGGEWTVLAEWPLVFAVEFIREAVTSRPSCWTRRIAYVEIMFKK